MKSFIKKYRWTLALLAALAILFIIKSTIGLKAIHIAFDNVQTVILLMPPIFILVGLMDIWIPRELIIKHMGRDAGWRGFLFAFLLGSVAVGPLYVAFPIAAILAKKGARFLYLMFFLGVWTSTKLPVLIYEYESFGLTFTAMHVFISLIVYLLGGYLLEKLIGYSEITKVYLGLVKK